MNLENYFGSRKLRLPPLRNLSKIKVTWSESAIFGKRINLSVLCDENKIKSRGLVPANRKGKTF